LDSSVLSSDPPTRWQRGASPESTDRAVSVEGVAAAQRGCSAGPFPFHHAARRENPRHITDVPGIRLLNADGDQKAASSSSMMSLSNVSIT
jgi:hypothetical protein